MIPRGMTEVEVIQIIDGIANRLAGKFKFGYHDIEDMKQQARLFAWQGLDNYDGIRPLENFLWTHVRNRLYNFKRNNFGRPDKPCDTCPFYNKNSALKPCEAFDKQEDCDLYAGWLKRNTAKRNIMHTINLESDIDKRTYNVGEYLDNTNLFNLIDQAIPVLYREDWIRFTHNLRLPKARRQQIVEIVLDILKEEDIDPKTW